MDLILSCYSYLFHGAFFGFSILIGQVSDQWTRSNTIVVVVVVVSIGTTCRGTCIVDKRNS